MQNFLTQSLVEMAGASTTISMRRQVFLGGIGGGALGAYLAASYLGLAPLGLGVLLAGLLGAWAGGLATKATMDFLQDLFNPRPIDPLVIDLDGDGIELTALADSQAHFDLDGDGFAERTGWVAPDDALLAVDSNGNGQIDDISELFGSATQTGYEQLAPYDTNGDGKIDAQDADFGSLLIWQDLNGDGVSDTGELVSLSVAGIASISVVATATNYSVNGNDIIETAKVVFDDGTITQSGEVLFDLSQAESQYTLPEGFEYDPDVFTLPSLRGFGEMPDLWVSMTNDSGLQVAADVLIADARAGKFGAFFSGFDDFLADWAGVSDTRWMQDVSGLGVYFAYRAADIQSWQSGDPAPEIMGYVFAEGIDSDYSGVQDWLDANGYVLPSRVLSSSPSEYPTYVSLNGPNFLSVSSGSARGVTVLDFGETQDSDPAPAMDASAFAFLQVLMGQEYRVSENFISPEDILVFSPSAQEIADLQVAYDGMRDYMASRFLAQAAWSILGEEGESADLGALAPFKNVFLNPFTDEIAGSASNLVRDLIDAFRSGGHGTDAEALGILAMFERDFPYIGALVAAEFPNIDRNLIQSTFEIGTMNEGTDANDQLSTGGGGILLGFGGDDTLTSQDDDVILIGGAGDDSLNGSWGRDLYLYHAGDGSDTISDFSYDLSIDDRLVFADINAADVAFNQNAGHDLVITLTDGSTVTITDHFDSIYQDMEVIEFADGTILTGQAIRDRSVADQKASGMVRGSAHVENYYHSLGDGSYTISDFSYDLAANDRLVFTNVNADQVTFDQNSGRDLVITLPNGETVTITDHFDGLYEDMEEIEFADGTILTGQEIRDRTVADQKASGAVQGASGRDIFVHSLGDGSYTINDFSYDLSVNDRLVFTDVNADQVAFNQNGGHDLVITLSNGETVTITDHFDGLYEDMEEIEFADGTILTGQAIRDRSVADQKASGIVRGSAHMENYYHSLGDGTYTINDFSYDLAANDRLVFTNVNSDQVTFGQNSGRDLVITLPNGETVTITDHFDGLYEDMEEIEFADGTILTEQEIRDRSVSDQKAGGMVLGSAYVENYYHSLGDGTYTINDFSYDLAANDRLVFTNVNSDQVTFGQNSGRDLVITLPNGETVTITDHFDGLYEDMEEIEFADGTILTEQEIRDRSVSDQKAGGMVQGSVYLENYYHSLGDGSYTINDFSFDLAVEDRIVFLDANVGDVTFSENASKDLVISFQNGETVTVIDHFDGAYTDLELFEFADGTVLHANELTII
ncbi:hypothetical protein DXV76_03540 [Rhodobacteraceae bacterium CCMM004]|nr:hypothetical protein DXV76_03540 [Rhodobacteraceae bacterium CCMM004]